MGLGIVTRKTGKVEYYSNGKRVSQGEYQKLAQKEEEQKAKREDREARNIQVLSGGKVVEIETKKPELYTTKGEKAKPTSKVVEGEEVQVTEGYTKTDLARMKAQEEQQQKVSQEYVKTYGAYGSLQAAGITPETKKSYSFDITQSPTMKKIKGVTSQPTLKEQRQEKRGLKNVGETYKSIGQRVLQTITLGRYKSEYSGVKATMKEGKTKQVVEYVANKPLSSAFWLTGVTGIVKKAAGKTVGRGVKAASQFVTAYVVGTAAKKGVMKSGEITGSEQYKQLEQTKGFKDVFYKSYAAERSKIYEEGGITGFGKKTAYEITSVASTKQAKQSFVQTAYEEYKKLGYSEKEAYNLAKETYRYKRFASTGESAQQIGIFVGAERVGRTLTTGLKTVKGLGTKIFTRVAPAGFLEGRYAYESQQKSRTGTFKEEEAQALGYLGGATAGFTSAVLSSPSKGLRRTTSVTTSVLDVSEPISDAAATLIGGKGSQPVKVVTPTITSSVFIEGKRAEATESLAKATTKRDVVKAQEELEMLKSFKTKEIVEAEKQRATRELAQAKTKKQIAQAQKKLESLKEFKTITELKLEKKQAMKELAQAKTKKQISQAQKKLESLKGYKVKPSPLVYTPTLPFTSIKPITKPVDKTPTPVEPVTPVKPTPFTKTSTQVSPLVLTSTQARTQISPFVQTLTKTQTQAKTKTKTSVVTPGFVPFVPLPSFPGGSGFGYTPKTKVFTAQEKVYTPSAFALGVGLKAKNGRKRVSTGLSIRPIIENKRRKY